MNAKGGSIISAALFIAAAATGVSYLTIPILTGIAGFFPAVVMTLLCWGFTLAISLLFAEATLGQPDGAHFVSISRILLGKVWMVVVAIVFFLNMISFLAAYAFFTEKFVSWFLTEIFYIQLHPWLIGVLSTLPFFFIIFLGVARACHVNTVLWFGLVVSFFFTIYLGNEFVLKKRLFENQWIYIFFSVPSLFTAFSFIPIVPPLCSYLNRNPKKIRASIWIGSLITLIVYLLWQWFLIGSIPTATFWVNFEEGVDIEKMFALVNRFPKMGYLLNFTVFFSMITSMISNGTGTVEFLCDAARIPIAQRTGWRRLAICASLLLLVLSFSLIGGQPFLSLLEYFSIPIGEVLISGIIPVWMVAQARYIYSIQAPEMLPGGRFSLIVLGIAIFILIYLEGIVFIRNQ